MGPAIECVSDLSAGGRRRDGDRDVVVRVIFPPPGENVGSVTCPPGGGVGDADGFGVGVGLAP